MVSIPELCPLSYFDCGPISGSFAAIYTSCFKVFIDFFKLLTRFQLFLYFPQVLPFLHFTFLNFLFIYGNCVFLTYACLMRACYKKSETMSDSNLS